MKRIAILISLNVFLIFAIVSCETLTKFPTNTTGGIFSLNGTWQLMSSNDADAMVGTSVTVLPVIVNGTVKQLKNNTYCLRTGDEMWKDIQAAASGGFSIQNLVSACSGSPVYKSGTIAVIDNYNIKLSSVTNEGKELIQQWKRLTK